MFPEASRLAGTVRKPAATPWSPSGPGATGASTSGNAARSAAPARNASRIRWSSITPPWAPATASVSALTRPSPAAPSGTSAKPGLVQNWPVPRVIDAASPAPISSPRSAAAASVTRTGFRLPSSPWKGMGAGRAAAASYSALPPRTDPVNPAAATSGCPTSATPASKPWTRTTTSSGRPSWAAARRSSEAHSSEVAGWSGWALTTTGQPAARALAVSPPGTEKASGKLLAL